MAIRIAGVVLMTLLVFPLTPAFGDDCASCHVSTGTPTARVPQWNQASWRQSFALTVNASETCMACHDGMSAKAMHHEGNHPVGVDYDRLQMRGGEGLHPSASASGLGGTIADDLLVQGRVECTSCHDQHAGHGDGTIRLRMNNDGSRLCLACHAK